MPESTGYAVKNNAESTVADNPLTSSATTLNVAAGQGSRFPSTFPFLVTIWDDVTHPDPTDDPNMEITECSARSSDALTIVRGKEYTSGVEHTNGARVAMLITAGIFNDPTYGISIKLNGIEDNATADQTKADIDALGINADQVDGCDAGNGNDQVHKIASSDTTYSMYIKVSTGVGTLFPGDEGKVLTTHSSSNPPSWETPSGSGDMLKSVYDTNNDDTVDDADKVDGCDAGLAIGDVLKIPTTGYWGGLYRLATGGNVEYMLPGPDGDILTTHGNDAAPTWETPASGSGDMLKSVYDTNNDGKVDDSDKVDGCDAGTGTGNVWKIPYISTYAALYVTDAGTVTYQTCGQDGYLWSSRGSDASPTWVAPYSHPSAPACRAATSGQTGYATAAQISKLDGIEAGATADQTKADIDAIGINAGQVDGCDAGTAEGNVWKIPSSSYYSVYYQSAGSGVALLGPSTDGYQLTTHYANGPPTWAASSDLIFSDTHCPKCGKKFEDGETLVLYIAGHNEADDILTIPMHKECAEAPKKTVTIKRKVMEDRYSLDEFTGEPRVQRVRKMQKKNVTKKRMKKDVELDRKTGEFWQLEDEKRKKKITTVDATEEYEEEIDEQIYKNVEFEL